MQPKDSSETELIEKLQNRDQQALAAVYDRYGQIAYSVLLRITRNQTTAEDLVQELFLRVWNRIGSFDRSKGSLGVWILSIARNMGIDHVRSAQSRFETRVRPIDQTDYRAFTYQSKEPESVIDSARVVGEAFTRLTRDQKRVLELAYFEGLSQSEIAAKLKEPLGTVKSWMRAGMTRLREAVKAGAA